MAGEKILIIEDNRQIVSILSDLLHAREFKVLAALDGARGLESALTEKPDLIILDWNLPRLSGQEVLERLREQRCTIPVILITIFGSEDVAVQAFRLGVRDYIRKPFQVNEVLDTVERALHEHRLERERERLTAELAQAKALLEQRLAEMGALQVIGQMMASVLDLEQLLHRVIEIAAHLTNAQQGALFLLSEDGSELYLKAQFGLPPLAGNGLRLQTDRSPLGQVVRTGKPLILTPKRRQPIKVRTGYLVHSLLYVPLCIRGRVIGVLGVANEKSDRAFGQHSARLLASLGDYAAVAIENARLYQAEKALARAETVRQVTVTLSHYILNPLQAIYLSVDELEQKLRQGAVTCADNSLSRNLGIIEHSAQEVGAVLSVLQELVSPQRMLYLEGIDMLDIEAELKRRLAQIASRQG